MTGPGLAVTARGREADVRVMGCTPARKPSRLSRALPGGQVLVRVCGRGATILRRYIEQAAEVPDGLGIRAERLVVLRSRTSGERGRPGPRGPEEERVLQPRAAGASNGRRSGATASGSGRNHGEEAQHGLPGAERADLRVVGPDMDSDGPWVRNSPDDAAQPGPGVLVSR